LIDKIKLYLKNHSRVSANRTYKKRGETEAIPVRYLDDSKIELYKKFSDRESISKSAFGNYLNSEKHIKKIARKTDVCDFCEWLRTKTKSITIFCKSFNNFKTTSNDFILEDLLSII
jgi:hypothetical protein